MANEHDVDMNDAIDFPSGSTMAENEVPDRNGSEKSQEAMNYTEHEKSMLYESTETVIDDWEEEDEDTEDMQGLQPNQSFWIFGESMQRFKAACRAAREAYVEENDDEFDVQVRDAKRNLKEILSAFLISVIINQTISSLTASQSFPAEIIAATIASQIRNIMAASQLSYAHAQMGPDLTEDSIISDRTMDTFDLLMTSFWLARDNAASKEKLLKLITCLAAKGKPHLIGMRWWSFVAG